MYLGPLHFMDPMLLCGALLLVCRMDAGGWLRISLLASVLHESGHILAYLLLMKRLPRIDVTLTGFCLHTAGLMLPPGREAAVTAAGPAANLAAALLLQALLARKATVLRLGFCWANLLVGGFNLLPVPPLDGATLLRLLFADKLQFGPK